MSKFNKKEWLRKNRRYHMALARVAKKFDFPSELADRLETAHVYHYLVMSER